MNITAATMNNAQSPEEAAQLFLAAISKGMAKVIAEKLTEVIQQPDLLDVNPQIAGWQNHVKGCAIDLNWERPLGRPAGQVNAFSPYADVAVAGFGGEISIGISIKGTF